MTFLQMQCNQFLPIYLQRTFLNLVAEYEPAYLKINPTVGHGHNKLSKSSVMPVPHRLLSFAFDIWY